MYANDLEAQVAPLEVDQPGTGKQGTARIDAIATVDKTGKRWSIALVNRDPSQAVACTVRLGDQLLDGVFDAKILAGDSPEAFNDIAHPNRVVPEPSQVTFNQGVVELPPHSLTIMRVR
jgi:alpha-N-arabinofuranosidase